MRSLTDFFAFSTSFSSSSTKAPGSIAAKITPIDLILTPSALARIPCPNSWTTMSRTNAIIPETMGMNTGDPGMSTPGNNNDAAGAEEVWTMYDWIIYTKDIIMV